MKWWWLLFAFFVIHQFRNHIWCSHHDHTSSPQQQHHHGLWMCSRRSYIPFCNHVYVWDDDTNAAYDKSSVLNLKNGKRSSRESREFQPRNGHHCIPINATPKQRHHLLHTITNTINRGFFIPLINDCFSLMERCLTSAGLNPNIVKRVSPTRFANYFDSFKADCFR